MKVSDISEKEIVFYDIETSSQYAPYCELKMVAFQLGIDSEPVLVDRSNQEVFRKLVADPDIIKVSYNGINFDDIVLWRYGFYVHPRNRHDMFLALKTIRPTFPSFSLKFVNWALNIPDQTLEDAWHEPEARLDAWLLHHQLGKDGMYRAPKKLLGEYCKHDVRETVNSFLAIWELVQQPQHWKPYVKLELAMGEPLHEMILLGQEYIDLDQIVRKIKELEKEKEEWKEKARVISKGKIKNVGSSQQVATYFRTVDKLELKLSDEGNFQVRKSDLLDLIDIEDETKDQNKIARCCYEVRDTTKVIGYLRSYLRAGQYEQQRNTANGKREDSLFRPSNSTICLSQRRLGNRSNKKGSNYSPLSIPKSYYLSSARTRRFQSSSFFGINWQNQNDRSKVIQLVPEGWLGFWLDSTQIENVVHIWASEDKERREAYEADVDWNEYVWLTNTVLGGNRTKAELDKIESVIHPGWSVYKQYKTIKLALNFGMGTNLFAETTGLSKFAAESLFEEVHGACQAIRRLQHKVRRVIKEKGYIPDPFGHIYSGSVDQAYKIVAYLVQGCGTGSIPKAMTVANYRVLHSLDSSYPLFFPCIYHPYRERYQYGVLCGTTHDECAGRISLGLPTDLIVSWLRQMLYNMEEKFSSLFDGIPLRAKLTVSLTNAAEQKKLDHRKPGFEEQLREIITEGKNGKATSVTEHRSIS